MLVQDSDRTNFLGMRAAALPECADFSDRMNGQMLRFLTAGESHAGRRSSPILEGMPAGLAIDFDAVTNELRRRQTGYGRGRRMAIEADRAQVLSGVRHGLTTGGPIALLIPNKDWENWQRTMAVESAPAADTPGADRAVVTRPRPGHADLAGAVKYGHHDIRNVLERASARETAARVAVGAVAQPAAHVNWSTDIVQLHVVSIGSASLPDPLAVSFEEARAIRNDSALHCVDPRSRAPDDVGNRQGQGGGRYDGRELRGHRPRCPNWPRQPRAVGS